MRRRRRRRTLSVRVPWTPVLWLALVLNCWAGLRYSPITDLRVVRVEGASAQDRAYIPLQLQSFGKRPSLGIAAPEVESIVLDLADVDHAVFTRSVFGEGRITITPRVPVVQIFGTQMGLTDNGSVVALNGRSGLPVLKLPPGSLQPLAGLAQPLPLTVAIDAARRLHDFWPDAAAFLSLDSDGTVRANSQNGAQVELGDSDDLADKLKVLRDVWSQHPELFKAGVVINVADPAHPVERKGIELKKGT